MAKSIRILLAIAAWASSKLSEAGTCILTKSYGVMISSKMNMILVYTRRSVRAQLHTLWLYVDDILIIGNDVKVLKRFKMENSKRGFLLMRHGVKLSKKQSPNTDEELKEIRYQACAGEAHWSTVKTILKYLKRIKDMLLIYGGGELILQGYNDASFQSDDDDAKSQSDFVFKLNGGVVAWESSKQATTMDSTTEAEYIAASEAAKDAV
ncbi:UNVERIFIED_CONTAM: Retrovirus-related Pol polyprotein from transposon TNT 1-94 [Sesamum latifolium]|uniref:Retrovirus-related Pol polyprotein from transposon TNT 1-94 n=1 Tax=Sesamum latifolium TaxID=2727402 RepID=A0AAW2TB62_9LAMI